MPGSGQHLALELVGCWAGHSRVLEMLGLVGQQKVPSVLDVEIVGAEINHVSVLYTLKLSCAVLNHIAIAVRLLLNGSEQIRTVLTYITDCICSALKECDLLAAKVL